MRLLRARHDQSNSQQENDGETSDAAEQAEFELAAAQLKERREKEAEQTPTSGINSAGDVEWRDDGAQYRPPLIEPSELISLLSLGELPQLRQRCHRVLINACVFSRIESHLHSDMRVELGGLLIGRPFYCPSLDGYIIVIDDAYPADSGKETAVSFEYTSETWKQMTPRLQEMPEGFVVVGSYHSHPGLGVFLSTTDIETQISVFAQEWQVALVVDPVRETAGFFISQHGTPVEYTIFGERHH